MNVTLYTTLGCHLCEDAEALLRTLIDQGMPITVEPAEIAESETLMARYGVRIPVVAIGPAELGWPFGIEALRTFIESNS